jgi:hypothetical protein
MESFVSQLAWLLDYEIVKAKRNRQPISLVLASPLFSRGLTNTLAPTVRQSDVYFEMDDGAAVLMNHTNTDGAMTAVNRYSNSVAGLRFGVVSFPSDGETKEDLMKTALNRLSKAKMGTHGHVICAD